MYRPNAGQMGVFGQNNIFQSLGSADEFQLEYYWRNIKITLVLKNIEFECREHFDHTNMYTVWIFVFLKFLFSY